MAETVDTTGRTNAVVDLSHHERKPDFTRARATGLRGVIHKATQGTRFVDPTYASRRAAAVSAGLLWGAYHFGVGVGGDGAAQAEHFLEVATPGPEDVLVLDLESNPAGKSMSLDEARAFVLRVEAVAGRPPGLYGGVYLKRKLGRASDPVLGRCWLWIAQYTRKPTIPPAWDRWTFWQYTDGKAGLLPYRVDGIGPCDRDLFDGSEAELIAFWERGGVLAPVRG